MGLREVAVCCTFDEPALPTLSFHYFKKPLSVIVIVVLITISVNKSLLFYICYTCGGSMEKKQELAKNRCEKRWEKDYFYKLVWRTFP